MGLHTHAQCVMRQPLWPTSGMPSVAQRSARVDRLPHLQATSHRRRGARPARSARTSETVPSCGSPWWAAASIPPEIDASCGCGAVLAMGPRRAASAVLLGAATSAAASSTPASVLESGGSTGAAAGRYRRPMATARRSLDVAIALASDPSATGILLPSIEMVRGSGATRDKALCCQ